MKVRIEFDDSLDQVEVIIRASQLGPEIEQIQQVLGRLNRPSLVFYKGTSEFFLKLEDLLFLKRMEIRRLVIPEMMPMKSR